MISSGRSVAAGTRTRSSQIRCTRCRPTCCSGADTSYTFDPRQPTASAIAVREGRILAVGEDLDGLVASGTRTIELGGRAVVPGLVDAHIHFGFFALSLAAGRSGQRRRRSRPGSRCCAALPNASHQAPGCRGAAGTAIAGVDCQRRPTWTRAIGDRPAALSSHDGHSLWLSSAAMRAVGLNASTQSPAGGVIERDERGEPTGVVFENAQDLVDPHIPEPTHAELTRAVAKAQRIAAAAGLTGLHNLEGERSFAAFRELEAVGRAHAARLSRRRVLAACRGVGAGPANGRRYRSAADRSRQAVF